jgi:hypothetical protein
MMQKHYGQLQADADAGTQPPVQAGSPELVKVIDPSGTAEQNARPKALIWHSPGPQSALPSRVMTMPPCGGEQAMSPNALTKHRPPGGGQATLPSRLRTQGFLPSFAQVPRVNMNMMTILITALKASLLMLFRHLSLGASVTQVPGSVN